MKEQATLGQSYLTVAQAAEELGVHTSTVRRWIDAGLLRAYRVGQKRVGVKRSDVERMVVPRRGRPKVGVAEQKVPGRMTEAEQRRGLKALEEIRHFRAEMAAKYGKLEPEGWVLLNEARDERTRQLMGGTDE